jgi:hypothetical protein
MKNPLDMTLPELRVAVAERLGWKRYMFPNATRAWLFRIQPIRSGLIEAPADLEVVTDFPSESIPPYEADLATALRLIQEARDRGLYLQRREAAAGVCLAFSADPDCYPLHVKDIPPHEEAAGLCRAFLIALPGE